MKAKLLFLSLLTGLLSLTACYYYAPSSVKYEGNIYKNGWYQYSKKSNKDLHVCGIDYEEDKKPLFNKNKYDFWFTDEFEFDFLYAEYVDSQFWLPDVYVQEDQLEEAKTFYQDKSNYNYYIGLRFEEETELPITDENEKAILDTFIDVIMKETSPKTITTKEEMSIHNLACYRQSKDGLFMTHREELVAYNQSIYCLKSYDGKDNTTTLYDLGEDGKALYTLFVSSNLI